MKNEEARLLEIGKIAVFPCDMPEVKCAARMWPISAAAALAGAR